ncbi:TPA: type II 3-dehydroquinate dehydratase [Candidatus Poribacteria bacterium]|nr:type II 3-dehydroquinate dehydratase [Candidatus Poribacteria bacterium]
MSVKILVIHGPNLNLLGKREPSVYGLQTLSEINSELETLAQKLDVELKIIQSNSEGGIVSFIHDNADWADGLIINPAAYTHTSVAIRDAISAVGLPAVEVHISNVFKREDFRHFSYISPVAVGVICGFGGNGYLLALQAIVKEVNKRKGGNF